MKIILFFFPQKQAQERSYNVIKFVILPVNKTSVFTQHGVKMETALALTVALQHFDLVRFSPNGSEIFRKLSQFWDDGFLEVIR